MASPVGFTFGDIGSVRDTQTASVSRDMPAAASALVSRPDEITQHRVGDCVADYSPLGPGDLVDPEVDAEFEAMMAASTVVRRSEGV